MKMISVSILVEYDTENGILTIGVIVSREKRAIPDVRGVSYLYLVLQSEIMDIGFDKILFTKL